MTTLDRLRHDTAPLAARLADHIHVLAKEYHRLRCGIVAKRLSEDEQSNLLEFEAKLNAFEKLLTVPDVGKFLRDEIRDAKAYLRCTRLRLSVSSPSGRMDEGGTE